MQYGSVEEDLAALPAVQHVDSFDPLGTTLSFAEVVASLDLVITVANTTAHVAACTETPVWVLLPKGFGCSWFWFREREDSPAYPGTRLFRQPVPGQWATVIEDVARSLDCLASRQRGGE